jgi:hypothetical protein
MSMNLPARPEAGPGAGVGAGAGSPFAEERPTDTATAAAAPQKPRREGRAALSLSTDFGELSRAVRKGEGGGEGLSQVALLAFILIISLNRPSP